MIAYGSLNNSQVGEVIGEMNFGESANSGNDDLLEQLEQLLKNKKQSKF